MAGNEKKRKTASTQELITVAFAEDIDLARQYKQLLEDNDIAAVIRKSTEMGEDGFSDIAILVSEEDLDEAHALITEESSYDFFDGAFDDPDAGRLEDGLYEQFDDDDEEEY